SPANWSMVCRLGKRRVLQLEEVSSTTSGSNIVRRPAIRLPSRTSSTLKRAHRLRSKKSIKKAAAKQGIIATRLRFGTDYIPVYKLLPSLSKNKKERPRELVYIRLQLKGLVFADRPSVRLRSNSSVMMPTTKVNI